MTGDPCILVEAFELLEDLRDELKSLRGWDRKFIEDMVIQWEEEDLEYVSDLQMHHLRRIHGENL